MTFTTAVLLSVFWLLIAAALGGLIIYFMLRSRIRILEGNLKSIQKSYNNFQDNTAQKQKELDLEIRARNRKLEIAQNDFSSLQAKLEEKDRALQTEIVGRMEVQNNFNNLSDEYHKLKLNADANPHNSREVEELKEELAIESMRRADIEANYAHLKSECEAARNSLKKQIQEKVAEISQLKSGISAVIAEETGTSQDQKNQALAEIREKAKSFDYSRIGLASIEDKDDLKIIVGIGPFIEEKLHAFGIYTFEQISKFTDEDVEQITEAIAFFPGRIQRDHWISQAAELWEKKKGN